MEKLINTGTSHGCDVIRINRSTLTEIYIKVSQNDNETPAEMFKRFDGIIKSEDAHVVKMDIFGLCSCYNQIIDLLKGPKNKLSWPVTWVQGAGCFGSEIAGLHVYAIKDSDVQTIELNGRVVGRLFQDDCARYCFLGDIRSTDVSAKRDKQTQQTFENMLKVLKSVGMNMSNVVRTWFYNDQILQWYGPFNEIRTSIFKKLGVFDCVVPASTGIGASNPASAATVASAFAVQPLNNSVNIKQIDSPLQGAALEYGSSFSRAVALQTHDIKRLFISGTASIGPDGKTKYVNDIVKQINLTMEVVEAILQSQQISFPDTTRAIAYFKHPEHAVEFAQYCKAHNLPIGPWLLTHNSICRDELLFEVELDAATKA